jgi:hypothetical protein
MTYFKLNFFIFQFLNHQFMNKAKFSYSTIVLWQGYIFLDQSRCPNLLIFISSLPHINYQVGYENIGNEDLI